MKKYLFLTITLIVARVYAEKHYEYYSSDPQIQAELDKAKSHSGEPDRQRIRELEEKYPGKIVKHVETDDDD